MQDGAHFNRACKLGRVFVVTRNQRNRVSVRNRFHGGKHMSNVNVEDARSRLVAMISNELTEYGYCRACTRGQHALATLVTKRFMMTRLACQILQMDDTVLGVQGLTAAISDARYALQYAYQEFPWFKELGTFLVVFCPSRLFDAASRYEGMFVDATGIHVNVILGISLVDPGKLQVNHRKTWGLIMARRHFDAIVRSIEDWRRLCGS